MQVEQSVEKKEKKTFSDMLRSIFSGVLGSMGKTLNEWGVHPNQLTTLGLVGTAVGAVFVALGNFTVGGIIILLMGPIDALDGAVARAKGHPEDFGAFVDSISDRYIEILIYGSLLWYYINKDQINAGLLVFLAISASFCLSSAERRTWMMRWTAVIWEKTATIATPYKGILNKIAGPITKIRSTLVNTPTLASNPKLCARART